MGELFIYTQMLVDDPTRGAPTLIIVDDSAERAVVRRAWRTFDAGACECFCQNDKQRMMAHIAGSAGGIDSFNRYIRDLAARLLPAELQNDEDDQESTAEEELDAEAVALELQSNSSEPEIYCDEVAIDTRPSVCGTVPCSCAMWLPA